jgi:hypothetical protein
MMQFYLLQRVLQPLFRQAYKRYFDLSRSELNIAV